MYNDKFNLVLACIAGLACFTMSQAAAPECDDQGVCTLGNAPLAVAGEGKMMWAQSRLFEDGPAIEVSKWLKDKPELEGKFIVLEFWRTWCGACKRMTPLMNSLQERFGDELAVIGVTGENEAAIKNYKGPEKKYFLAIDQEIPAAERQARAQRPTTERQANAPDTAPDTGDDEKIDHEQGKMEAFFSVWGWPHVVILEPQHRAVIWEGFSGQQGYELTVAKVERILELGRAAKKAAADAQQKAAQE